jgi:hypothetical protein
LGFARRATTGGSGEARTRDGSTKSIPQPALVSRTALLPGELVSFLHRLHAASETQHAIAAERVQVVTIYAWGEMSMNVDTKIHVATEEMLRGHLMLSIAALLKLEYFFALGKNRGPIDERLRWRWQAEIDQHDPEARAIIAASSEMRAKLGQIIETAYHRAIGIVSTETGIPIVNFPECAAMITPADMIDDQLCPPPAKRWQTP